MIVGSTSTPAGRNPGLAQRNLEKRFDMFFEEHPWLLVVIIIAVVEVWNLAKETMGRWLSERRRGSISGQPGD